MWLVALLFALGAAVVAVLFVPSVSSVWAAGPPPAITCTTDSAHYGEAVTCSGSGDGAASLAWPDGTTTSLEAAAHNPAFVGSGQVTVVDADGTALVSAPIEIAPDLVLECDDGAEKTVYKLAETDLREEGWDYVYEEVATGREIYPGDPDHPAGAAIDGIERIVIEMVNSTGFCKLHSQAADDLGGDFQVTLDSPWEGVISHPVGIIGPASKTRWAGTQPAELTGTVTVNGVSASERQGVYMSGCT